MAALGIVAELNGYCDDTLSPISFEYELTNSYILHLQSVMD